MPDRPADPGLAADLATLRDYLAAPASAVTRTEGRAALGRVEAELSRLREDRDEALGKWSDSLAGERNASEWMREAKARAEAAEARCARLQQALAFYADEANWRTASGVQWLGSPLRAFQDKGGRAREALAGLDTPAEEGT